MALIRQLSFDERAEKLKALQDLNQRASSVQSRMIRNGSSVWEAASAAQEILSEAADIDSDLSYTAKRVLVKDPDNGLDDIDFTGVSQITLVGAVASALPALAGIAAAAVLDISRSEAPSGSVANNARFTINSVQGASLFLTTLHNGTYLEVGNRLQIAIDQLSV